MASDGQRTIDINSMSKNALKQLVVHIARERDEAQQVAANARHVIAVLAAKHDRGAIFGADTLLVSATLELPAPAHRGLPDAVNVELHGRPDGSAQIVVTRAAAEGAAPAPSNGDRTAKPALLGGDGKPL